MPQENQYPSAENVEASKQDAAELTRKLRRMKRQLFLEYVNGTHPSLHEPQRLPFRIVAIGDNSIADDAQKSRPEISEAVKPPYPRVRKGSTDTTATATTVDTCLSLDDENGPESENYYY